jgi:DNA polymerase-3 subunit delta
MAPPSGDPLAPLRTGDIGPLYFLFGKERFLLDRAVDLLRTRVLDPRTKDFNYEMFQGKEATASRIVAAARTLPMMAKRRLVLVRDADEAKTDELNGLVSYVQKPAVETCLVFVGEKPNQTTKFFTAFKKAGVMVKLDPLPERRLADFIREEAKARGVALESGVAELLRDEAGPELGQLADAVERLTMFVGERKKVTLADCEEVVASTRQRSIFELCDAVADGSRARALAVLGSMTAGNESGVRIVSMLARTVRQLWTARELLARRAANAEITQALGLPPFIAEQIIQQARRFDRATFDRMHDALFRADRDLKSIRLEDARVLERLMLELVPAKGAAPTEARR